VTAISDGGAALVLYDQAIARRRPSRIARPGHLPVHGLPLSYEVDIVPLSGPTVVQVDAAPAGDQGLSASYESGFSFSIGGEVEVSGDGPTGDLQAGVSWDNTVSTTVPHW
jgi:hypothetical protein